jgi:hypothetical protein
MPAIAIPRTVASDGARRWGARRRTMFDRFGIRARLRFH